MIENDADYFVPGLAQTLAQANAATQKNQDLAKAERGFFDKLDVVNGSVDANLQLYTPVFSSAYGLGNIAATGKEIREGEPLINPLDAAYTSKANPEYFERYLNARTDGEWHRINDRINYESELRDREQSWWGAPASFVGIAITDPGSYIPINSAIKATKAGAGLVKGFGAALPGAFVGGALSEGSLLATQETRKKDEALFGLGIQTLVGAAIGGGVGAYAAKAGEKKAFETMAEQALKGNDVRVKVDAEGKAKAMNVYDNSDGNGSVGAAETLPLDYNGDRIVGFNPETKWYDPRRFIFAGSRDVLRMPIVRMLSSESPNVRRFGNELIDHSIDVEKSLRGENLTQSLESRLRMGTTQGVSASIENNNSYLDYLGLDPNQPEIATVINAFTKKNPSMLSKPQWDEQVYLATISDSADVLPQARAAANKIYKQYREPINLANEAAGNLNEGQKPIGADRHMPRLYDTDYITNNRLKQTASIKEAFIGANEEIYQIMRPIRELEDQIYDLEKLAGKSPIAEDAAELASLRIKRDAEKTLLEEKIRNHEVNPFLIVGEGDKRRLRKILNDEELTISAENTIKNILGSNVDQLSQAFSTSSRGGSSGLTDISARVLMVEDTWLIKNGFLKKDYNAIMHTGIRQSTNLLEVSQYLKNKGWDGKEAHLNFLANDIDRDYDRLISRAVKKHGGEIEILKGAESGESYKITKAPSNPKDAAKLDKELARLEKAKEADKNTVKDTWQRVTNTYNRDDEAVIRVSRVFNNLASASELGGLALTMVADTVATSYRAGLKNFISTGIVPAIKRWIGGAEGKKFSKALRNEAADLGLGIELESAVTLQTLGLEVEGELALTRADRVSANLAKGMSVANFSAPISDMCYRISTTTLTSQFIRNLKSLQAGTITKNERAQLALYGLAGDESADIVAAVNKYGKESDGAWLANWSLWNETPEEVRAAAAFQRGVDKAVRSVIFSGSSSGSFPSGIDPKGRLRSLFTFMGWGFQAHANYFLPLVQRFDANKVTGTAAMIGMSMFTEPLRQISRGDDPDLEPAHIFTKGILNSGTLGIFVEWFNKANAISELAPDLIIDRYKGKGWELAGGYPAALIRSTLEIAGQAATGEWNVSDLKRASKLIPILGALPFRYPVQQGFEELELPATRAKAREGGA